VLWVSVLVLSCIFVGFELAAIFMSYGILFGVALLMGESCVQCGMVGLGSSSCWVSINCEQWLMIKRATNFYKKERN
jgi:hypothetical protein